MTNGMKVLFVILIIALKVRADCQAGEDCNKNCSTNCQLLPNGNPHCHHITGECSEGCLPGFYTPTCNVTCSENCPNKLCDVIQGTCLLSCENLRCGSYCERECNDNQTTSSSEAGNTCTVPWTVSLVLAGIIGVIVLILFLFLLRLFCRVKHCIEVCKPVDTVETGITDGDNLI